jgi:CDGSH-type Zn-finger protein
MFTTNDREKKTIENLENSKGQKLSNIQGIALCRCGASKNKPFCDGSHFSINFKDKKTNINNNLLFIESSKAN